MSIQQLSVQGRIEEKLATAIDLAHLEVINESHNHNVPAGSSSHFKVVLVSDEFQGQSLLNRHKRINQLLQIELANDIHALAIHTMTPVEWVKKKGQAPMSPPCLGGSA